MTSILIIYGALVTALTVAELKESQRWQRILKPLAALGFLSIAFFSTALFTTYGQIIFVGLLACAIGDVLLLSRKSPKLFLFGMAAFAIGHFAYLTGFILMPREPLTTAGFIKSAVVIFAGYGVFSWLKPHLPKDMRIPVTIYFLIILIMVLNALRLPPYGALLYAMIGAVMFAVSDVFVGRDRFVTRDPINALAITPLYFGAQALIAISTKFAF